LTISRLIRSSFLMTFLSVLWGLGSGLGQEAVVVNPVLNVRSGPGTKHEIVGRVKEGDRFPVVKVKKSWVQIKIDEETLEKIRIHEGEEKPEPWKGETWVFRRLIQFVGKPPDFEDRQIEFQNWALDVIPVTFIEFKSDSQIWIRLPPDKYASKTQVRQIARKIAEEYKKQTGFVEEKVVVKVLRGTRIYVTASIE
jgi:hypothetical protein